MHWLESFASVFIFFSKFDGSSNLMCFAGFRCPFDDSCHLCGEL